MNFEQKQIYGKAYLTDLALGYVKSSINGIIHKNIIDWLLEENS